MCRFLMFSFHWSRMWNVHWFDLRCLAFFMSWMLRNHFWIEMRQIVFSFFWTSEARVLDVLMLTLLNHGWVLFIVILIDLVLDFALLIIRATVFGRHVLNLSIVFLLVLAIINNLECLYHVNSYWTEVPSDQRHASLLVS